jgi:hypothetical protein
MSKSKPLSHSYGQETWNFLREVEREVRKSHSLSTQIVLSGELRYVQRAFSPSLLTGVRRPLLEAQGLPRLAFTAPSENHLIVSVNLNAPFPSFAPLSPALHWVQAGFKAGLATADLTSSEAPIAPPISSPHRYVFFSTRNPWTLMLGSLQRLEGKNSVSVIESDSICRSLKKRQS